MKKYVAGLMFSENRESVALIVKNKPDWQKGLLNGIGGKIELEDSNLCHGDTIYTSSIRAMVREFEEETGVETNTKDWELFLTMGSDSGKTIDENKQEYSESWSVDFYRCFSNKVYEVKTMTDEHIVVRNIVDLHSLNTIYNLKWIILLALDKNPKFTETKY
jgi:8-oxo-dGTP diphosphatase